MAEIEQETTVEAPVKRRPGRPRKHPLPDPNAPKRRPGRPRKTAPTAESEAPQLKIAGSEPPKPKRRRKTRVVPVADLVEEQIIEDNEEFEPGQEVTATQKLPKGWQRVRFDEGFYEAWPKAEAGSDNMARKTILDQVDKAWEKMIPTPEVPDKSPPKVMLVNAAWRKMFRNVMVWGDDCSIMMVQDDRILPTAGPHFKFLTAEQAEEMLETI